MRHLPTLARALAFVSVVALLTACKTTASDDMTTSSIPNDYRQRHPIAVREGEQTLTVFIGERRGALTPTQRAEVGALAPTWRRDATGGFVIDVPFGTANERAAMSAAREIRAILAASGVPHNSIEVRPYRTDDPARLGTLRVNYPRMFAETGPCGLWPRDLGPTYDPIYNANKPYWNSGCSVQRNLCRASGRPCRSCAAAFRRACACVASHERAREVPQG